MDIQNKSASSKNEEVGYRRPPQHTRFKKGQSGNPHGRPKGTPNLATVLERMLREPVSIEENGKSKKVTKLEAAIKQLADKAASGEFKAVQLLTALVRTVEGRETEVPAEEPVLDQADEKVWHSIVKRVQAANKKDPEHENLSQ